LHTPPSGFRPGDTVHVQLSVASSGGALTDTARLHYRHVNQDEGYQAAEMRRLAGGFGADVPGGFTSSVWALQYYFELRRGSDVAWLYPGIDVQTWAPPYFVLRQLV
jgi:hypothetical protein